jgi:hypothetical protein
MKSHYDIRGSVAQTQSLIPTGLAHTVALEQV